MVEALGPEQAEQWRVEQGVEVGTPDAMPDAGAETPMGALAQPMTAGNSTIEGILAVQRRLAKDSEDERNYQRKRFEEGRARLEQQRMGPSASEQLFRLAAAFAQPQRYKGFGGMMNNVSPVLADMAAAREKAGTDRAAALERLQDQYMSGDFAARRQGAGDELRALQIRAGLEKPQKRRTGFNPITGQLVDMDTAQPIEGGIPPPPKVGEVREGYVYRGGDPADEDSWATVAQGGPTQSASGGFQP